MALLPVGIHDVTVRDAWTDHSGKGHKRLTISLADKSGGKAFRECYFSSADSLRWSRRILSALDWDGATPLKTLIATKALTGKTARIRIEETEYTGSDGTRKRKLQVVSLWRAGEPEPEAGGKRPDETQQQSIADAIDEALVTGVPAKPTPKSNDEEWNLDESRAGEAGLTI